MKNPPQRAYPTQQQMIVRPDPAAELQQQQDIQDTAKAIGVGLICLAIVFALFNLAFIIPDLIYAGQGSSCVTTMPDGFSFNLSTWLKVDAYTRIAMVALLLLVGIASCISVAAGMTCGVCLICFLVGYSMFSLAWTIVGSVMFWGKLNPTGVCQGGVQSYMFALLIISFVGICCNCIYSLNSNKNRQAVAQ